MSSNKGTRHVSLNPVLNKSGRNLDPSSNANYELKEYRTSVPEGPRNNWRLYPRSRDSPNTRLRSHLLHLNAIGFGQVGNILERRYENKSRTLKTPKLAKYLANIEAKYNNPRNMKNYVYEIPDSNLTSEERRQLMKNINGRYPAKNYTSAFNANRASRKLAPRASNAARLKADKNGAPAPPVFNPANVVRNLTATGSARGGTKKHRKTRNRGRK